MAVLPFSSHASFLPLLTLLIFLTPTSDAEINGTCDCRSPARCRALVTYAPSKHTTLRAIQALFSVTHIHSILELNNLPSSTHPDAPVPANHTISIPFPCECFHRAGHSARVPLYKVKKHDSLFGIANELYGGLVEADIIAKMNLVKENEVKPGQELWIPIPCCCDGVPHDTRTNSRVKQSGVTGSRRHTRRRLRTNGKKSDRISLLAFKAKITDDPSGIMQSWNDSTHMCEWLGVTCCRGRKRVTVLNLSSRDLAGELTPHIGNLSFLRTLDLGFNRFRHVIPEELGRLHQLEKLILANNTFSGGLPTNMSLFSNLRELDLGGNNLSGGLPKEFASLPKLELLGLYNNKLTGMLPPSIANISSLYKLSIAANDISGVIPDSLGRLTKLKILYLAINNLIGVIPYSIYNISSLEYLELSSNRLGGPLPPDLGLMLPNLKAFAVASNRLIGTIPVTLSNLTKLSSIQLADNKFSGTIPSLARLKELDTLTLSENKLGNGSNGDLKVLQDLANCSKLRILELGNNNLGGIISDSIGNLSTRLQWLLIGGNKIQGRIPASIGNLINLERLVLSSNQLTGTIPSSMGQLSKLAKFHLIQNELSGGIPSSLGNLTSLLEILLSENNLGGRIPPCLMNCRNLLMIDLSVNHLTGTIPREILSISSLSIFLDLSNNLLTGPIPNEIKKLVSLGVLDLSNNRLSGQIPSAIGSCISLERLYLEENSLSGMIPQSMSSMRALHHLNISSNNLTGHIPEFMGDFGALFILDMSFNDFEGKVPMRGIFKNASIVSLSGNPRLCGGVPQFELPACNFPRRREKRFSMKLRLIIGLTSSGIILATALITIYIILRRLRVKRILSSPTLFPKISRPRITYHDLVKATEGFASSNLIGTGSFGSVYKGIIGRDGSTVAVKTLNLKREEALKSFMAECEVLREIKHRNLVELLTVCSSIDGSGNDFKALVYRFLPNGSLDEWLHPVGVSQGQFPYLSLGERLNIAIDVATGLDYLHNHCSKPVVHRDLKPSNILLDTDKTACIGDFGLARLIPEAFDAALSIQLSSAKIKGSIGYIAPEFAVGCELSVWADVYSFGILLLEMFTGKRPTDDPFARGVNLHDYIKASLPVHFLEAVDPRLVEEHTVESGSLNAERGSLNPIVTECLVSVLEVGISCSMTTPRERQSIANALAKLIKIRNSLMHTTG